MAQPSNNDTSNFFHVANYDESYWTKYLSARPSYSPDFYHSLLTYHRAHSTSLALAHDVGAGPGQVASSLASHFAHVVVTDNNETHVAVAQRRLASLAAEGKVSFGPYTAESLSTHYPAGSADFIAAAECITLLDAEAALDGFATLLRPGGTLAVWFYGRPAFAEEEYAPQCEAALGEIMDECAARVSRAGGAALRKGWKRSVDRMMSWLDDVRLDAGVWGDVERMKWNVDKQLSFCGPASCDFEIERRSAVGEGEKVVEVEDRAFWAKEWDVAGVRRFVEVNLPQFEKFLDSEIEEKFERLEEAMGGSEAVRKICWPVSLILATRK